MGLYTFGMAPGDAVTDSSGNVVANYPLSVWADRNHTTAVSSLYQLDGVTPISGGLKSGTDGRPIFKASDAYSVLYLWDGNAGHTPWPTTAVEVYGQITSALSAAQTATTNANSALNTATTTQAQQTQLMTTAALSEEVVDTYSIDGFWDTATWTKGLTYNRTFPIWSAPYAASILSVDLTWDVWSLATNDTNYWAFTLQRERAGTRNSIAGKNTTVASGQAVTARVPWGFSGATWDANYRQLSPGDVLILAFSKGGAPVSMDFPLMATIRWVPL